MKLKVIGWDSYDFSQLEEGENNWAATQAVIDEIKKNKLYFSGFDHQERDCCAPVLNDGKIRRFPQRGFGGIMAQANGFLGAMDYSIFMFGIDEKHLVLPKNLISADEVKSLVETDLNETFYLEVNEEVFEGAKVGKIRLDDLEELNYIDGGDKIELSCLGQKAIYEVVKVDRDLDNNDIKIKELKRKILFETDFEKGRQLRKQMDSFPLFLYLTVKGF